MKARTYQVSIKWPLKALFHYVCDIENHSSWQSRVIDAAWVSDARHCSGAYFNEMQMVNEKLEIIYKEVIEHVPYQRRTVSWQDANCEVILVLDFEPLPEYTLIKASIEVGPCDPSLTLAREHISHIQTQTIQDLENLKAQLESEFENNQVDDIWPAITNASLIEEKYFHAPFSADTGLSPVPH
jgi:hypothetical protein